MGDPPFQEPLSQGGHATSHQLQQVYVQAKLDYLRMQPVYNARQSNTSTFQLCQVMEELRSLYKQEAKRSRREKDRLEMKEGGYIGGRIPLSERGIPAYDALNDRHCTYIASKNFHNSPFMRLKRAADYALKYFGQVGKAPGSPWLQVQRSSLSLLSPLARPDNNQINKSPSRLQTRARTAGAMQEIGSPEGRRRVTHSSPSPGSNDTEKKRRLLVDYDSTTMPYVRGKTTGAGTIDNQEVVSPGRKRNKVRHVHARPPQNEPGDITNLDLSKAADCLTGPSEPSGRPPEGSLSSSIAMKQTQSQQPPSNLQGVEPLQPQGQASSSPPLPPTAPGPLLPGTAPPIDVAEWYGDHCKPIPGSRLLDKLRHEVLSMRKELAQRGLITLQEEEGEVCYDSSMGRSSGLSGDRAKTPPWVVSSAKAFTKALLFQDRVHIADYDYVVILTVWLMECGSLEINTHNVDRDVDLEPFVVHPLFVDQLCGFPPEELADVDEAARKEALASLFRELRVVDSGTGLRILIEPFIYEDVQVLSNRRYRVQVLRLTEGNGLLIVAEPTSRSSDPTVDKVTMVIYDFELEVLLCQQPGLFRRVNLRWSAQKSIAQWLVARLELTTDSTFTAMDDQPVITSQLRLDRSILLPPERSWAVGRDGIKVHLRAFQDGQCIAFESRREVEGSMVVISSEKVHWYEAQAFIGASLLDKDDANHLLNKMEDSLTPLDYVLSRVSVGDEGYLHVNRLMLKEVRTITGCTVVLYGGVVQGDLLFEAHRIQVIEPGGADKRVEERYTKVVTALEALKLVSREPYEVRKALLTFINRPILCRALVDALCFVDNNFKGLSLETTLYMCDTQLVVAIMSEGKESLVGSVKIDDRLTLGQLRDLLEEELDQDMLPSSFTFLAHEEVPISLKQESELLAKDFLPKVFIAPRITYQSPAINLGPSRWTRPYSATTEGSQSTVKSRRRHRHKKTMDSRADSPSGDLDDIDCEDQVAAAEEQVGTAGSKKRLLRRKATKKKGLDGRSKLESKEQQRKKTPDNFKSLFFSDEGEPSEKGQNSDGDGEGDDEEGGNMEERKISKRDESELVAVPLLALVTVVEGERIVRCSEDLRGHLVRGDRIRLEFPDAPDHRISGHREDSFDGEVFTLEKPFQHFVPGLEGPLDNKPPPPGKSKTFQKTPAQQEREKQARAKESRMIMGESLLNAVKSPSHLNRLKASMSSLSLLEDLEKEMEDAANKEAQSITLQRPYSSKDTNETCGVVTQSEETKDLSIFTEVKEAGLQVTPKSITAETTPRPPVATGPKSAVSPLMKKVQIDAQPKQQVSEIEVDPTFTAPAEYMNIRIYKLRPKSQDKRSQWRVDYEDGKIPYKFEYKKSNETTALLGINIKMSKLEAWVKDDITTYHPTHQQRVDFFDKLDVDKLKKELWHKLTMSNRRGEGLPVTIWQALLTELNLLPKNVRSILTPNKLNELVDPTSAVDEETKNNALQAGCKPQGALVAGSLKRPGTGGSGSSRGGIALSPTRPSRTSTPLTEPPANGIVVRWSEYLDSKGKIDYEGFEKLLNELARLTYPQYRLDPLLATKALVFDKVLAIPEVLHLAWAESKQMAMAQEAKRQAVAMKIQSFYRRNKAMTWYKKMLAYIVTIQAQFRRAVVHMHYHLRLHYLDEDRLVRIRYASCIRIQCAWRVFSLRKKYLKLLAVREASHRERLAERRSRQREKKRLRNSSTLLKRVRIYGGVPVAIQVIKKDGRKSSKKCDMVIKAYIPQTQETIDFELPEMLAREYIESHLGKLGLAVAELLEPRNIDCLVNRLLVKSIGGKYQIIFSKRAESEKGKQISCRSIKVNGVYMVIKAYRTSHEVVFRAYDPLNCEDLRVVINTKALRKWLQDEERKVRWRSLVAKKRTLAETRKLAESPISMGSEKAIEFLQSVGGAEYYMMKLLEEEKEILDNFEPELFQPKQEKRMVRWLMARLSTVTRKSDRARALVLSYEIDRVLKNTSAAKIQGLYRIRKAREHVRDQIRRKWEKQRDWKTKKMYYMERQTGLKRWTKPRLLGPDDLPDPKDEFRLIKNTEDGRKYWFNPATGQTCSMSPHESARILQSWIRRVLDRVFGLPVFGDVVKSLLMIRSAPKKYEEFPDRLTCIFNYALVLHTQEFKWDEARPMYLKAIKKGPDNPVVMRCYAIYLLGCCEEPREENFKKALDLFGQAKPKDPDNETFQMAEQCFFRWALIVDPKNPMAMMNYALVQQGITGDYHKAEYYYRRALTIAPYEPRLLHNFEDFLKHRLPGGAYGTSGPSVFVVKRSEVVDAREMEWGEWKRMRDTRAAKPEFENFWYNSLNRLTQWAEPDFAAAKQMRIKRCTILKDLGDWQQLQDAARGKDCVFWYHRPTQTLQLQHPFGGN